MSDVQVESSQSCVKNPGFLRSTDGIFKGVQLILSLLLVIFVSASHYWSVEGAGFVGFANFAATFDLITLILSFIIYFYQIYNSALFRRLPWRNVELFYALGSALMHFLGMILCAITAANSDKNGILVAAAIFSVLLMFSFLGYAFVIFRGHEPQSVQS